MSKPVCLTVAGSDSGGGAGIQADLKAFAAFGAHGTSAVTCLTAQNPDQVPGVFPVDPDFVALQIRTVCEFFPVAAIKTGMVYSSDIIQAIAEEADRAVVEALVVDPVMVATSGARLLTEDALRAMQELLLPLASVVTPNVDEAEMLCGTSIAGVERMVSAAREIAGRFKAACVIKGGHERQGTADTALDILCVDGQIHRFQTPRVKGVDSHGSGCAFASAIAAGLAKGMTVVEAVGAAKEYICAAIDGSVFIGSRRFLSL